jgi:hypothetical protein
MAPKANRLLSINNLFKMKNIILVLLLFGGNICTAQVEILYSTTPYCSEENKGTIEIDLNHKSNSTWYPPYHVEYVNVNNREILRNRSDRKYFCPRGFR